MPPYWINLYNALTVRVVLDHYPVDSIRDIDICHETVRYSVHRFV